MGSGETERQRRSQAGAKVDNASKFDPRRRA